MLCFILWLWWFLCCVVPCFLLSKTDKAREWLRSMTHKSWYVTGMRAILLCVLTRILFLTQPQREIVDINWVFTTSCCKQYFFFLYSQQVCSYSLRTTTNCGFQMFLRPIKTCWMVKVGEKKLLCATWSCGNVIYDRNSCYSCVKIRISQFSWLFDLFFYDKNKNIGYARFCLLLNYLKFWDRNRWNFHFVVCNMDTQSCLKRWLGPTRYHCILTETLITW